MRLVTRSDFDGLICAVILKEEGVIDEYKFVHPKDIQDGKVMITSNDVLTNVPYWPGCGMWFDHHSSEDDVQSLFQAEFVGESRKEKSCARIVYEYYGGKSKYPNFEDMVKAVDKSDSGDLQVEDILYPKGWMLLSFVMDPRTGLGRYKDYKISNYQLMEDLIDYCRDKPIEEILEIPDVKERVDRYLSQTEKYKKMIRKHSKVYKNCAVIDLRSVERPFCGNRFLEYTMHLQQNVSIRVMWGLQKQNVVFAVGHSILNKTSKTNVGELMHNYGGGGHVQVGTCQVPADQAEEVLLEIIKKINADG
jgi:oligoribonuclease NrnB/cAMP/cGMP phosphodiesterase (DHH superfamily)